VRSDTWYNALLVGNPRSGLGVAQPIRLGGFMPERTYELTAADQVTGVCAPATVLTADAEGKLALSLPAGAVDVVWLLHLRP